MRSAAVFLAVVGLSSLSAADSMRMSEGLVPTPIGVGPSYHPGALNSTVSRGLPVGRLTCTRSADQRVGVHLELFGRGRVVIVPAGIGVAPPWHARDDHVLGGRCSYPARTLEPTGVIQLLGDSRLTLGMFFELWGQPLDADRLAGFRASGGERVRAYVDGRRWRGDARAIPLRRHAEIVLELGASVPPHPNYHFERGL